MDIPQSYIYIYTYAKHADFTTYFRTKLSALSQVYYKSNVQFLFICLSLLCSLVDSVNQRRRGGMGNGSRYKLPAPGGPEGGLGPDYVVYIFVFLGSVNDNQVAICRVDVICGKLTSGAQRWLLCFLTFHLAGPRLLWGPNFFFFHRGPNPLSGTLLSTTGGQAMPTKTDSISTFRRISKPFCLAARLPVCMHTNSKI